MVLPSDWLLGIYGVVACIYEWLCGFLSFQSVFVDFHCCHCILFCYFILCFLLFHNGYLQYDATVYSINSGAAVERRPYPANYCFVYNSLTSSFLFLFLFILFLLFFYEFFYSFGFINPSSSLLVQIGVGSPAAFWRLSQSLIGKSHLFFWFHLAVGGC